MSAYGARAVEAVAWPEPPLLARSGNKGDGHKSDISRKWDVREAPFETTIMDLGFARDKADHDACTEIRPFPYPRPFQ